MMSHYINSFLIALIIIPALGVCLSYTNLLNSLLFLEVSTLNMVIIITLSINTSVKTEILNILIILTLGACEAVLGLSSLILMSRSFGSDNPNLMISYF